MLADAGVRQKDIAERFGISPAAVCRALGGKQGGKSANWSNGRIAAQEAYRDYKDGLTLDAIRWKYGYRTPRVALAAMERIAKELEG